MQGASQRGGRLVGLAFACVLLGGLELGASWLEPDTRLGTILSVLEEHPTLLWKQRDNLDVTFFGGHVETEAFGFRHTPEAPDPSQDVEVLILGASPTFGWGVHDGETYAARLQARLEKRLPGRTHVTNGAGIGYSSGQGLALLEEHIARIAPDIVTVSFVINDVDSYRLYRSDGLADAVLQPQNATTIWLRNLLARSALCRQLAGVVSQALSASGGATALRPGASRVSPKAYRANLEGFLAATREADAQLILIKMPVNLPLGPEPLSVDKAGALFEQAESRFNANDCAAARPLLEQAIQQNALHGEARYLLGTCLREGGDIDAAREMFASIKRTESHRCARDAIAYNAIMAEFAATHQLPLVDVVEAFANKESEGYLYVDAKLDTYHPNARGHALIAEALTPSILSVIEARGRAR